MYVFIYMFMYVFIYVCKRTPFFFMRYFFRLTFVVSVIRGLFNVHKMIQIKKHLFLFAICIVACIASGCMSKDITLSEQQERMLRCDKYVAELRERCLSGELVSVSDYNDELSSFKKAQQAKIDAEQARIYAEELSKQEKFNQAMREAQKKAEEAKQQAIEAKVKKIENDS